MLSLNLPDCDIRYLENFLTSDESKHLLEYLNNKDIWKVKEFYLFGKKCKQNRETCAFSDHGVNYKYNGMDNIGEPICNDSILYKVKLKLEKLLGKKFNYALCNRYKDGTQNIGMHSDDERGLNGPIASISVGLVTVTVCESDKVCSPLDNAPSVPVSNTLPICLAIVSMSTA